MLARHRKLIAVAYWIFVALVYIVGLYQANNEVGVPTVVVTLPWSIFMLLGVGFIDSIGVSRPLLQWLTTAAGNFVMFPLLCGGVNAALIYGLGNLRGSSGKDS